MANSHQRRKQRRKICKEIGCGFQGYSGTTPYPDLMCTDGRMSDMDCDGDDPSVWRVPCPRCLPIEHIEYLQEVSHDS